jgi:hypothetical protein
MSSYPWTGGPPMSPPPGGKISLYNEWLVYHRNNPRIYQLICKFAADAIRRGTEEWSIAGIWELIRWQVDIETGDPDFKMPNNHKAYYARLWLKDHPNHPKFFRICELRSEGDSGPVDRFGRPIDDPPKP